MEEKWVKGNLEGWRYDGLGREIDMEGTKERKREITRVEEGKNGSEES